MKKGWFITGTLTSTLRYALPTLFFGVPRVWEKIYEKMVETGRANKGLKRQIGDWAKKTGLEHNRYNIYIFKFERNRFNFHCVISGMS